MSLVKSYEGGRESHARIIVQSLFEEYLSVEELFNDNIQVFISITYYYVRINLHSNFIPRIRILSEFNKYLLRLFIIA